MKKRILSLCIVLLLCLGLLPTTVLAADNDKPNNLYVGNQNVKSGDDTTYWATTDSGELELVEGASDTSNNWNVKYDPNSATLTLKNATIEGWYDDVNTSGAGIYAASSSGPVSLNIVLEEENKVSGMYGIDVSSSGGSASLNISGSGSLTVSGHSGNGIGIFMSSQNSANLTIEEASVTALGSQVGGSGVRLITSQTGSPSLTIEVKGGSLQASGETNGIHFLSNVNDATAVANLNVSGNAMVKASNIITTKDGTGSAPELKPAASGSDGTGGIIWDGKNGTVYGDVTLDENLTIGEGESLTIPEGSSLDMGGNEITVASGGKLDGTPTGGTVVYGPTITKQPEAQSVTVGQTATFTITANGSEPLSYQWQQSTDSGQSWTDIGGATDATYTTEATTTSMNGYQYCCVVSNSAGSITSDAVSLTVNEHVHTWGNPVWSWTEDGKSAIATFTCENDATHKETPGVTVTPAVKTPATCTETGVTTYTATVEFNGQIHTDTKDVADIPAIGHKLTKTEAKAPTSTDTGNIEYWYCKVCDKYFSDEKAEHEITLEDTIIAKLPKLISGANQEWTKGSKDGLTFKVDTDINEFKKVLVDGKELKDTNYDIKSGSTILTLTPSYLNTLTSGKHEIRIEFTSGSIVTNFTIKDQAGTTQADSANTGVQNHAGLWSISLVVALSSFIGITVLYQKKQN